MADTRTPAAVVMSPSGVSCTISAPFDNMPSPCSVESAKIRGSCIALFPHQSLSSACSGISMHVKTGFFQLDVLFRMGLALELGLLLSWELVREESHSQEFSSSDFSFASLPIPGSSLSDLAPTSSSISKFVRREMPSCMAQGMRPPLLGC